MTDTETLDAIRKEMTPLAPRVMEALNSLPPSGSGLLVSRWNSKIDLFVPRDASQKDSGIIRRDGTIEIAARRIEEPERWRTYLHELVHAHSPLSSVTDYEDNIGWEEAVVEGLQRRIRPSILGKAISKANEAAILLEEKGWLHAPYMDALEKVRAAFEISDAGSGQWYAKLLALPIKERYGSLLKQAVTHGNRKALAQLAIANIQMTKRIR